MNGINQLTTFEFHDTGILVKKAAGIGEGLLLPISKVLEKTIHDCSIQNVFDCQIVQNGGQCTTFDSNMDPRLCSPANVKVAKIKKEVPVETSDTEQEEEVVDESGDQGALKVLRVGRLHKCNCSKEFITKRNYERHVNEGSCLGCSGKREMSIVDHLKRNFFAKFREEAIEDFALTENMRYFRTNLERLEPIQLPNFTPTEDFDEEKWFCMGFALAPKEKNAKISSVVKAFVLDCFNKGQKNKEDKLNYAQIAKLIQDTFDVEDWLKESQVKGQIVAKLKKLKAAGCDNLDPAQMDLEAENHLAEMMAHQHIAQTHEIIGKEGDWLTSHPLKVSEVLIPKFQYVSMIRTSL